MRTEQIHKQEHTTVAIIGAGVSGLTLATFLKKAGIACIIIERRDREYIQMRQRAGVVEARGVRMFERWNLADQLLAGPVAQTIDYKINGESQIFNIVGGEGSEGRFCTQQMLVNNLLRELIDHMGGDVRWNANDVSIDNAVNGQPKVTYFDANGKHEIICDFIAGCDADRGVSRDSIPEGVLTKYSHEFGYAWLAPLVEAPLKGDPIMGVSDYGFVGQLPRGPQRSRYYLQCDLNDEAKDWPDERIWDEIRLRLNDDSIENAPILEKFFVPLRSVVYSPMQHEKLFLVGDAAHLVPPTSAKGMNMALFDVDVLAQAISLAINENDMTGLENYSNTCLAHTWTYQDFAVWMTDLMHQAGNSEQHGVFMQQTALARLKTLFSSETAAYLHSEYQRGMV